jgi:hypothetical protein
VVSASPFSRRLKTELLAEKKDKNFSKRKTVLKRKGPVSRGGVCSSRLVAGPEASRRRTTRLRTVFRFEKFLSFFSARSSVLTPNGPTLQVASMTMGQVSCQKCSLRSPKRD